MRNHQDLEMIDIRFDPDASSPLHRSMMPESNSQQPQIEQKASLSEEQDYIAFKTFNRILLVDDEPYNIQAMIILLKLVFKRLNIP